MRNSGKNDLQGFRIKWGSIGGNALQSQSFAAKSLSKSSKKFGDISMGGRMIKNLEHQAMKSTIVDNRKNTERAIINLVNGNLYDIETIVMPKAQIMQIFTAELAKIISISLDLIAKSRQMKVLHTQMQAFALKKLQLDT
jgi:hypothetical protein